jgi:hypothetical protein
MKQNASSDGTKVDLFESFDWQQQLIDLLRISRRAFEKWRPDSHSAGNMMNNVCFIHNLDQANSANVNHHLGSGRAEVFATSGVV